MSMGNGLTTFIVGGGLFFLGAPALVLGITTGCIALMDYIDQNDCTLISNQTVATVQFYLLKTYIIYENNY